MALLIIVGSFWSILGWFVRDGIVTLGISIINLAFRIAALRVWKDL